MKRLFCRGLGHQSKEDAEAAWAAWFMNERAAGRMSAEGFHEDWKTYLGAPVAFQRCPEDEQKMREQLARKKTDEATTRARQPRLD